MLADADPIAPYCLPKPAAQAEGAAVTLYGYVTAYESAAAPAPGIGMLHEEKGPRRSAYAASRYHCERPVKIYG